ncbi:hypothetical protein CUROG_01760 [Corynebacterium urogenitale]|uniref:Cell wall anchor protein n=2 Tax=Corynebacterium urogenitale TaxID=2487892 RepID=A0A5J6Z6A9_9CORY|nr:hypothetical protein CUROG_01760 [Corynebacterium urogenitale]
MSDNTRSTTAKKSAAEIADEMTEHKEVGHRSHMAGAFDIRNVIGALMGIYGLVLLASYLVLDPGVSSGGDAKDATYNLWAGVAMVVVAAVFFAWSKFEPVKIDQE